MCKNLTFSLAVLLLVSCCFSQTVQIGSGTEVWGYPFNTFHYDCRTMVLYTAQEMGAAGYISSVSLEIATAIPSDVDGFKIRFRHTDKTELSAAEGFDIEGWIIAFAGKWPAGSGWKTIQMDKPFYYNGTDNLLIDIIIDRDQWWYQSYGCLSAPTSGTMSLAGCDDNGVTGDPQVWCSLHGPTAIAANKRPNIKFEILPKSNYAQLGVMCFNIRGGFNTENDPCDNWSEPPAGQVPRRTRVLEMIMAETETFGTDGADIIGLQEVWDKNGQVTDVFNGVDSKYAWSGIADDGTMSFDQGRSYNPVLYKKGRFNCIDQGVFWLSETPDVPSTHSDQPKYRRIATWVILHDNVTNSEYFVLNAHLDHISVLARQYGAELIMSRLAQLSCGLPVIVMGDMNSYEKPTNNAPYIAFTTYLQERSLIDCFRQIYPMEMAMERTFSTWDGWVDGDRIDFMFTRDLACYGSTIERKPLYNRCVSDHYPITSTFYVPKNHLADINDDNIVDLSDMALFCDDWLKTPQLLTNSSVDDGLIGRWSFDSQISGLGYTDDGISNGAAIFDGFEDTIHHNATLATGLDNFTIAFWVKLDRIPYKTSATYYMMNIVGDENKNAGNIQLSMRDNSRFRLEVYSDIGVGLQTAYSSAENAFVTNKWYHVAVVYSKNPNQVKFYIDGVFDRAVTLTDQVSCRIGPLYIGSYANSTRFLDGTLDELRIYNRQLSETEIAFLATGASGIGSAFERFDLPSNFLDKLLMPRIIDFYDYSEFCWYFGQN